MTTEKITPKLLTYDVKKVGISLASPEEIRKQGVLVIENPHTIGPEGLPIPFGLSDPRLGAISKVESCRTCEKSFKECKGHFGTIELEKPVLNILFLKQISKLVTEFCHKCSSKVKFMKCESCDHQNNPVEVSSLGLFYVNQEYWPLESVRDFLSLIKREDLEEKGVFSNGGRPEWAISHVITVPPLKTRPTIFLESGGRAEDDLTYKLIDIIKTNLKIKALKEQDLESPVIEVSMLLQYHYVTYLDNSQPRVPISKHRNQRALRCLSSRISGKEGRIRYNLGGKRTNHSARAIIVPDSSLEINEVGIPQSVANQLTKRVLVTEENKKDIEKELLKEKSRIKFIYTLSKERFKVIDENKKDLCSKIEPGVTIKRSLIDGDYCLFNRQPSLHRHSIQGHKIKISSENTNVFSINPLVCYPYNADFDGDEMNLHIVQDLDAEKEIETKTDVTINAVSEKSGYPILGLIKDHISGLYLLSTNVEDISLSLFYPYLTKDKNDKRKLKGSEIIGMCFPEEFQYTSADIVIQNNKLTGVIKKKHFSPENKLVGYAFLAEYGSVEYTRLITKLSRIACLFEDFLGLTVPISFFSLSKEKEINQRLRNVKNQFIAEIEANPNEKSHIERFRGEMESEYDQILEENKINNIMVSSGSSGSQINITQIYAAIGQQNTHNSKLIENPLLRDIIYPFYHSKKGLYEAKGLVTNSYKSGLTEVEYFNHCIAGRESIVDSNIKTSISGYFQRRLINALADIHTSEQGFIIDSEKKIYQFPSVRFYDYCNTSYLKVKKEILKIQSLKKGIEKPLEYSFYPEKLKEFLKTINTTSEGVVEINKLILKSIVPNKTPVGILGSQAIGEPATQLTLRSFHHSGVGELDIVQGIEKIILVTSLQFKDKEDQRILLTISKNREDILKLLLVNLNKYFKIIPNLEENTILLEKTSADAGDLKLYVEGFRLSLSILKYSVVETSEGILIGNKRKESINEFKKLIELIITKWEGDFYEERLDDAELILKGAAGSILKKIKLKYPDSITSLTTNILEIEKVEGIEQARKKILVTLSQIFENQGTIISYRYLALLADTMAREGTLRPLSRTGIISTKDSFLARAAFESTVPVFVSSSCKNKKDELRGVIERILINKEVTLFK